MRKLFVLSLIGFLCSFAFAFRASESKQIENDIFGYYFISGKVPKAFADINHIHLAGNYGKQQKPLFYGLVRLKNGKDFPILSVTLNGKKVSFITKTVGGVHYYFNGTFTRLSDFPSNPPQGIILQGKLSKLKNNKKFADTNVKFRYEAGD